MQNVVFEILPRSSGKTTRLKEMYKQNPGIYFCYDQYQMRIISGSGMNVCLYRDFDRMARGKKYKHMYFDEFFSQSYVNYDIIQRLIEEGVSVYIVGTPYGTHEPTEKFEKFLKENYPEALI